MALKSKRRVAKDDPDNAFIDDEGDATKRSAKKAKTAKTTKPSRASAGPPVPGGGARDDDGSEYWELSPTRRVTVSKYMGKVMINIREYYSKDDQMLPGKKGINLPIDQFSALIFHLPHIRAVLEGEGEEIPLPEDRDTPDAGVAGDGAGKEGKERKKNIEATSDEEEEEEEEEVEGKKDELDDDDK
ncbi:MAG: hypothetical protein M1826_001752 [Phylliscum demangeonii]|nr:MAG: hypothetical protein M1826_001752 [Phylliscum demangeonii]